MDHTKSQNRNSRHHDDWDEVHNQLLAVQKKSLGVSDPNDANEKEADAVAQKVVNGSSGVINNTGDNSIQRKEKAKEFVAADGAPEFSKWAFNTVSISKPYNCAKTVSINGIDQLGKNLPDMKYLCNGMELAAEFKNNPPDYTYTFSRMASSILYYKLENQTQWLIDENENRPTPAPDVAYGPYDACETPSKQEDGTYRVYSVDRPGLDKFALAQKLEPEGKYVNEEAHRANFTEKITVKDKDGKIVSENTFDWHSNVYAKFGTRRLEYVDATSDIGPGLTDLTKP